MGSKRRNEPRVGTPLNREDVVVVTGVSAVEVEGSELASEVRRSMPNLNLRTVGDGDEPAG